MTTSTPLEPTSDEKVMGALAYFFGMLGALLVWLLQREKSRFVRFHALQALGFDLIVMVFMFVVMFCSFGVMFLGMFGTMFAGLNSSPSEAAPLLMVSTMGMALPAVPVCFPDRIGVDGDPVVCSSDRTARARFPLSLVGAAN